MRASRFIDEPCDGGEASRVFIGKPYGKGHSLVLAIDFINREVKMRASGNPRVAREPNEVPGLNRLTDIGSSAVSKMCVNREGAIAMLKHDAITAFKLARVRADLLMAIPLGDLLVPYIAAG